MKMITKLLHGAVLPREFGDPVGLDSSDQWVMHNNHGYNSWTLLELEVER